MYRGFLLLCALALVAESGCEHREEHYTEARIRVDGETRHVELVISGRSKVPCPPAVWGGAFLNGVRMDQQSGGGPISTFSEDPSDGCDVLIFEADDVPMDSGSFSITFQDLQTQDGKAYREAKAWRIEAPWSPVRIWADDLEARLRAGEDFEVQWEPPDSLVPELFVGEKVNGAWTDSVDLRAEQVSAAPGRASFRFRGEEPSNAWDVVAHREFEGAPTRCEGFESCEIGADVFVSLRAEDE